MFGVIGRIIGDAFLIGSASISIISCNISYLSFYTVSLNSALF